MTTLGAERLDKYQVVVCRSITSLVAEQSAVWGQSFPVAAALDDDLVAGVGQAVQGAVPQGAVPEDGIIEEAEPFFDGPIAADDETGSPVSVEDEVIQVRRLLSGETVQSEVVEDEQVGGDDGPEGAVQ